MQRSDAGNTLASRPAPNATVSPGWVNNDRTGATAPTIADPDWANGLQAEIESIIAAGTGASLSKTAVDQLLTAIQSLMTAPVGAAGLTGSASGSTKTASWTANEIVAKTALGGRSFIGANLTLNFDGSTTGAGGMDTGTLPASATDLAVYAIYNPTTKTWSTLGQAQTGGVPSRVYSGAHMPSGYTASALIWSGVTSSAGNIQAFSQIDRNIYLYATTIATGLTAATWTSLSLGSTVPRAAKTWFPLALQTSIVNSSNIEFAPTGANGPSTVTAWSGTSNSLGSMPPCPILTPQTIFYQITAGQTWNVSCVGYSI